jgi:hypothetical protein
MTTKKLPSFQFYPGDWMKDPSLRRCSHAAKGLLMDLLCLMFEAAERGVLASGGQAWSDDEIISAVGGDPATAATALQELLQKGALSRREDDGAIYSRRVVRDEERRTRDRDRMRDWRSTKKDRRSASVAHRSQLPSSSTSSSPSSTPPSPPQAGGDCEGVRDEEGEHACAQPARSRRTRRDALMQQLADRLTKGEEQ